MITYQNDPVNLVAVDQSLGDATIRLADGRYQLVPICRLRGTHGAGEVIQAVRRCEEQQRREQEQEATR